MQREEDRRSYRFEMGHHSCCNKQKVRRGLWSPEEDEKLIKYISTCGHGCWSSVPRLAGLQRCGKSCRLRWMNYLRPDLKRGSFSPQEESLIIELHRMLGNRWAQIAKHLPGRTDNEVKNFWNSTIKKKLMSHGVDFLTLPGVSNPIPPLSEELLALSTHPSQVLCAPDHLYFPAAAHVPQTYWSQEMLSYNVERPTASSPSQASSYKYIWPLDHHHSPHQDHQDQRRQDDYHGLCMHSEDTLPLEYTEAKCMETNPAVDYDPLSDIKESSMPPLSLLHQIEPNSRLQYFASQPDAYDPQELSDPMDCINALLGTSSSSSSSAMVWCGNLGMNPILQPHWAP